MNGATAATMPQPLPPIGNPFGRPLTTDDYRALSARWIDRKHADDAMLSRVSSFEGSELLGNRRGDCAGLLIPYLTPGESNLHSYRIRRDNPEVENGKPKAKYLAPPGAGNRVYFPRCFGPEALADTSLDIVITEGEFKAIALACLARHNATATRFLPLGIPGVWNWRGTIGKVTNAKGARVDEKGVVSDFERIAWGGRRVVIAFDADAATKPDVRAARWQLSRELRSRGALVGFLEWDIAHGKGVDDWLGSRGPEEVLAALADVDFNRTTGWRAKLKVSESGKPKPLLLNADIAMRHAPEWEGAFAFDQFRQKVRIIAESPIGGEYPRDWADSDDTRAAIWMQQSGIEVGRELVGAAVQAIADENPVHPLRNWLRSLRWDGEPRVDKWLVEYLGAAASDYVLSVGRMWLISAVARVMKPGCKADHMLVLEARQGAGKSRALRILAGDEYFCDSMPDLRQKDAQLQTFGTWIIEWAELDAMSRAETTAIKDFLTRQAEKLRRPYGHHTEDVPRQCVFAGTTNTRDYLRDETGNRRFWPVSCGRIDCEALARDREQLWAEAVALFDDGATWWPERADLIKALTKEQEARVSVDPWLERISCFIEALDDVKAERIMSECLELEVSRQGQAERNRVGRCLRLLNWEPSQWREGEIRVRGFRRIK
jgi:predicted P-loop ATPase